MLVHNHRFSFWGGTVFGLLPNLPVTDLLETAIMASVGALISFAVSMLLKWLVGMWKSD